MLLRPNSNPRLGALCACVAAVAAAHVLVLGLARGGSVRLGGSAAVPPPAAVQVRWLAANNVAPQPSATLPPAHAPFVAQADAVAEPAVRRSSTPSAAAAMSTSAGEPGVEYVPRSLLSTPPVPLAPIEVPFPSHVAGVFSIRAELSLFIDETGVVQRVRLEGAPLPPALADAARNAFLRARFSPGELEGRAVRSLVRVEVNFESEARAEPDPTDPR